VQHVADDRHPDPVQATAALVFSKSCLRENPDSV